MKLGNWRFCLWLKWAVDKNQFSDNHWCAVTTGIMSASWHTSIYSKAILPSWYTQGNLWVNNPSQTYPSKLVVQDRIPLAWLPKPTVVCCGCDQRTDTTLSMLDETSKPVAWAWARDYTNSTCLGKHHVADFKAFHPLGYRSDDVRDCQIPSSPILIVIASICEPGSQLSRSKAMPADPLRPRPSAAQQLLWGP